MTRAFIYARVSSEEQAGPDKTSIQTQLTDCRALAAKLGWIVVAEYVDDKRYTVGRKQIEPSGTRNDRPQWRRMLAELAEGRAEAVLSWHSSRLYRGYKPMADFLEIVEGRGVQVALAKEHWSTDFAVFGAWQAKMENSARVDRMRFGKVARAKRGFSATSTTRFYKPVRDPDTGEVLGYEFDNTYRAAFDLMARLFIERLPYHAIAARLGTHPRTGKPWNYAAAYHALNRPFFRGFVEFGRTSRKGEERFLVRGRHNAAWDESTCQAIEIELARRAGLGAHGGPRANEAPFAGIIRCGWCGRTMTASRSRERTAPDGRMYRYYYCHANRLRLAGWHPGETHPANGIPEYLLIRLIEDELAQFDKQDADTLLYLLASQSPARPADDSGVRAQLAEVEAQIADLEPELDRVRSAVARGAIDAELARLTTQAELYRQSLDASRPEPPVDLTQIRAALAELADNPDLASRPDPELKHIANQLFTALYVAGGQIVAAPDVAQ